MINYFKQYWEINLMVLAMFVMSTLFSLLPPIFEIKVLDAILHKDLHLFVAMLAFLVGGWFLNHAFNTLGNLVNQIAERKIKNQMRNNISLHLLKKKYQDFHSKQIGDYISLYTSNIEQTEAKGLDIWPQLVCSIIQAAGATFILFNFHWSLAVFALAGSFMLLQLPKIFTTRIVKSAEAFSKTQENFVSKMKDVLSGMDIIKTFQIPNRFLESSSKASMELENAYYSYLFTECVDNYAIRMGNLLFQVLSYILMAALSIQAIIPATTIIGGGPLISMVFNGIALAAQNRVILMGSKTFFDKTYPSEAWKKKNDVKNISLPNIKNEIIMENISYSYSDKQVLNHLSLSFEKGKKYALIGASGSGKTTILKILLNQLSDYKGKVLIDGVDAHNYNDDSIYQQLAYIEQDVFLFNDTIRENITLGHQFSDTEVQAALRDSALIEDLKNFPDKLDTIVGENGRNLSGGQKQRIAIARALIHKKSYLLVDEGTSALDKKNAELVEQQLLKNPQITLILITHHLNSENRNRFDEIYDLNQINLEHRS